MRRNERQVEGERRNERQVEGERGNKRQVEGERGNGRVMGSDGIIMCHSESGIVQKDNALLENKFLENIL